MLRRRGTRSWGRFDARYLAKIRKLAKETERSDEVEQNFKGSYQAVPFGFRAFGFGGLHNFYNGDSLKLVRL